MQIFFLFEQKRASGRQNAKVRNRKIRQTAAQAADIISFVKEHTNLVPEGI